MKTALALLIAIVVLFTSVPCLAVSVNVAAAAGYGGICKIARWNPITITLSDADEEIDGTAVVSIRRGRRHVDFVTPVRLAPSSKKQFVVYAPLGEYSSYLAIVITNKGRPVAQVKTPYRSAFEDDVLLVEVAERSRGLSFLTGTQLGGAGPPTVAGAPPVGSPSAVDTAPTSPSSRPSIAGGASPVRSIQVGFVSTSLLPDKPRGFDGADVLVLSDMVASRIQPASLDAIRMWIAGGGSVIVCGGADYARLKAPFFEEILPVKVDGSVEVPDMNGLLGRYPYPFAEQGSLFICRSTPKPGSYVLSRQGRIPLIAVGRYGLGSVILLAFDPRGFPFGRWGGEVEMWRDLVLLARPWDSISRPRRTPNWGYVGGSYYPGSEVASSALEQAALAARGAALPSPVLMSIFLIVYLMALVPANYYALRRMNRYELAWVTTPAIIVFFTFGAWAAGYAIRGGETVLNRVAILETASNTRAAGLMGYLGLYAVKRGRYDLSVDDPYALLLEKSSQSEERFAPAPAAVMQDDTAVLSGLDMEQWSARSITMESGAILKGPLESDLEFSGSMLIGRITNYTGLALHDCVICFGGGRQNLRSLGRDETAAVAVSPASVDSRAGLPPGAAPDADVRGRLREYFLGQAPLCREPVLIGFTSQSGLPVQLQGRSVHGEDLGVVIVHLQYKLGSGYSIPEGLLSGVIVEKSSGIQPVWQKPGSAPELIVPAGGYFIEDFRLPVYPGGPLPRSLRIRVRGSFGSPREVRVQCYNWLENRFDRLDMSAGMGSANPKVHVRPSDGIVRLKLTSGTYSSGVSLQIAAEGGER